MKDLEVIIIVIVIVVVIIIVIIFVVFLVIFPRRLQFGQKDFEVTFATLEEPRQLVQSNGQIIKVPCAKLALRDLRRKSQCCDGGSQ